MPTDLAPKPYPDPESAIDGMGITLPVQPRVDGDFLALVLETRNLAAAVDRMTAKLDEMLNRA